jgi:hypothetical protein
MLSVLENTLLTFGEQGMGTWLVTGRRQLWKAGICAESVNRHLNLILISFGRLDLS